MAVQISLENDEALVLFELLASGRVSDAVEAPERNALWALESLLQKQLVEPLSPDYSSLLARARASLVNRYGN